MKISGAIFDADGTLLDSMPIWENLGNAYLIRRGITPREHMADIFRAMSLVQSAEYYQTHYGITDSVRQIIDDLKRMVAAQYRNDVPLKPGVADFLAALHDRGVPMVIATATDRPLIEDALIRCGIRKYFDAIFTCREIGCGKDRPDIYLRALAHLGTAPEETVIFEDALFAIRTAVSVGCPIIAVQDTCTPAADNAEICKLARLCIRSFDELCDIFC